MSTKRKSEKRTSLLPFFNSIRLPKGSEEDRARAAVKLALRWRPDTCIEDFSDEWFESFDNYLKKLKRPRVKGTGYSYTARQNSIRALKKIARQKYPYRFLVHASDFDEQLRTQKPGFLGKYFVEIFQPASTHDVSTAVRWFHEWKGGPIRLKAIDLPMLDRFQAWLEQKVGKSTALAARNAIRQIVNHWQPGRIPHPQRPTAPTWRKGTVQHTVESEFIDTIKTDQKRSVARRVMKYLDSFADGKPMTWQRLDRDAEGYVRWLRDQKSRWDKPLSISEINAQIQTLNDISAFAAKRKLITRPFRLKTLFDPKRAKPATDGHAGGNGEATKRAATTKGTRGPAATFGHPKDWLLKEMLEGRDGKPLDLRDRYHAAHPTLPLPKKRTFSAFVSSARSKAKKMRATVSHK